VGNIFAIKSLPVEQIKLLHNRGYTDFLSFETVSMLVHNYGTAMRDTRFATRILKNREQAFITKENAIDEASLMARNLRLKDFSEYKKFFLHDKD
jgi:hypothetical protein